MHWDSIVLYFIVLLVSLTFHEAAHATFALLGGDKTAYHGGQVTLNPLPHIQREPFGMVILPLLALLMSQGRMCVGFASTPVDPLWAHRHPRKAALMSAAGPLANATLAAIAFVVLYRIGKPHSDTADTVVRIAGTFLLLNVYLGVLNLIPLPPLDGAGIVTGLFPATSNAFALLARTQFVGLIVLVAVLYVLPSLFVPVFQHINGWLPYPYRPPG